MNKPNKEQQQVIDTLDKNILLLAAAGTGKTGTLARRIANILDKQLANPQEILCLTFTNKASREIQEAIATRVGKIANKVEMGTFHSFCYKILCEESKRADSFYNEMTIFDEIECEAILLDLLYERFTQKSPLLKGMKPTYIVSFIKEQRALLNNYSNDLVFDYNETIQKLYNDYSLREKFLSLFKTRDGVAEALSVFFIQEGAEFIAKYDRVLRENHGVDFVDLIVGVDRLFKDDKIIKRWQKRFSYICIDEVQDTSLLEYRVLKAMWKNNHIMLSGDFFQTIYEWRGSVPFLILKEYCEEYTPVCIAFYENYRSTQVIFETALDVLEELFPNEIWSIYDRRPKAYNPEQGLKIKIVQTENEKEEYKYIFQQIMQAPSVEGKRTCILVRNNFTAKQISSEFAKLNKLIPLEKRKQFFLVDDFSFYRRMEIKDVMAFLKLLINPHDVQSAKRIIKKFVDHVGVGKIAELESPNCRRTGLRLPDFLDLQIFEMDPYEKLIDGLNSNNVIVFDVESTGVDTTTDEIIQMAAIKIDSKGQVIDRFERFIKPTKSVGASKDVHGFSDEYLQEHGEDAKTILKEFLEFSKESVVVGHNVQYDVNIFTSELGRHDMGSPLFSAIYDTLDIYRRFYPNEKRHTLEYLSNVFETRHKPSHNAMDDILATAELLIQAVEKNILPTKELRRVYTACFKGLFAEMASTVTTLRRKALKEKPTELLTYIMKGTNLAKRYEKEDKQNIDKSRINLRMDNLRELYRIFKEKESKFLKDHGAKKSNRDLLQQLVRNASLQTQEFELRENSNLIPIITVHQSKGSEFHNVYLANMVENQFPSYMSIKEGRIEEEHRLFYVAITRAKEQLCISNSRRNPYGKLNKESRYLKLIPLQYSEKIMM